MADDIICKCFDCVYYHSANGLEKTNSNMMCHFALDNGYPRSIPPVDCYKKDGTGYISKKDKNKNQKMAEMKEGALDMAGRKYISVDIKQAAVDEVNRGGVTIQAAADKYGVGKSSLTRWLKEEREKTGVFGEDQAEAEFPAGEDEKLPEFEVIFPASELVEVTENTDSTEDIEPVECCESSENVNEDVYIFFDRKQIKASAFDEIADITDSYPDRSARELLFYINGIIGLTARLCGGSDNG